MIPKWSIRQGLVVTALLLLPTLGLLADHLRNVQLGAPLPPFKVDGLDGRSVGSPNVPGKVLVLVYLSARQHQSEEALAGAHRVAGTIGSPDLSLVYMSADVTETTYFRELRDRLMAHEPFALDPVRSYYGTLGLIAFPTTVVTSKDGKLLHMLAGWSRDYEHQLALYCRHALGEFDAPELAKRLATRPAMQNEARDKAERHRSMAAILRQKGMPDGAIQELEHALAADPGYADAAIDLCDLLVSVGKLDDAEKRVNDLLGKQPQLHRAKLTLGLIKLKRGQLDEAEKLLTEALVMNPDPIRSHYYLGQLYERKGEHKLAMEHYRDALKGCLNER